MESPMWKKQMARLQDKYFATIVEREALLVRAETLALDLFEKGAKLENACKMNSALVKLVADLRLRSDKLYRVEEALR